MSFGGMEFGDFNPTRRGGTPELTAPESLDDEDYRVRHLRQAGRPLTSRDLTIKRADGTTVPPPPEVLEELRTTRSRRTQAAAPPPPPAADEEPDDGDDAWGDETAVIDGGVRDDLDLMGVSFEDDDDLEDLLPHRSSAKDPQRRHRRAVSAAFRPSPDAGTVRVLTPESVEIFRQEIDRKVSASERRVEALLAESEQRTIRRVRKLLAQMVDE